MAAMAAMDHLEIIDQNGQNGDLFYSYVSLPKGTLLSGK